MFDPTPRAGGGAASRTPSASRRRRAFRLSLALVLAVYWLAAPPARAASTLAPSADGPAPKDEPFLQGRWDTPIGLVRFDYVSSAPAVEAALERALPSATARPRHPRMAIVHPALGGQPLGAGHAGRLELRFEDADPIGPIVDLGNGEYAQAFREREGPVEGLLTVTVAGISTDAIAVRSSPTGPPISSDVWWFVGALVAAQVAWLAAVRPGRRNRGPRPPRENELPS